MATVQVDFLVGKNFAKIENSEMFGSVTRDSQEWVYSDQPHSARRGLMLAKYPLIKKYMCADHHFKYIVS